MTTRQLLEAANSAIDFLATSRPTAVNLFWALDRMREVLVGADVSCSPMDLRQAILNAARQIHEQDIQVCRTIGRVGADLVPEPACILTHCNTGSLATSEYGTALSVIFTAQDQGKRIQVYVCETRPLLQGARLTAWELQCRGIPNTLICDSAAGMVMKSRGVQLVLTGADRIVANGDAANKIGTYGLAVLARAHNIPFYIVAPRTSFDLATLSGEQIPIEERASEEITHGFGKQTAPEGIDVFNPAFDVTPAHLITGIITEAGVIQPVSREIIAAAFLPQAPSTPPPGWLAAPQR
jgi:methylthioribose-1-phosphate isomerase